MSRLPPLEDDTMPGPARTGKQPKKRFGLTRTLVYSSRSWKGKKVFVFTDWYATEAARENAAAAVRKKRHVQKVEYKER